MEKAAVIGNCIEDEMWRQEENEWKVKNNIQIMFTDICLFTIENLKVWVFINVAWLGIKYVSLWWRVLRKTNKW